MTIEIEGAVLELPKLNFEEPGVKGFVEYLKAGGEMSEPEAERFVEAIVSEQVMELADGYLESMRGHVNEIQRLRGELRTKYDGVLERFRQSTGKPVELPPELEPEVFRDLFNQLADEIEALKPPEEALAPVKDSAVATTLREAWQQDPTEVGLPPRELPPPEGQELVGSELSDVESALYGKDEPLFEGEDTPPDLPLDEPWPERGPSVHEQQRVERLEYGERFVEPPGLRARVRNYAQNFLARRGILRAGWRWWIERTPRFGATEAQLREFAELDPNFSAEGFGLVLRSPGGKVYKPDAIIEWQRGDAFSLGEYKKPLGEQSQSFYNSLEGRQKLFEDMWERALMSQELPNCEGWVYDTGAQWLDDLIYQIRQEMAPELGDRILVPKAKVQ